MQDIVAIKLSPAGSRPREGIEIAARWPAPRIRARFVELFVAAAWPNGELGLMPTTLVQLTDTHLVPEGARLPSGLDPAVPPAAAIDAVNRASADVAALLLTGDLTDAGDPASYARLRRMLDPVEVPVLCAAGNDDDRAALREHLLGVDPSDALHHPPLPSPSGTLSYVGLRDPAGFAAVLAGSDVRIVLCGHTHVASASALTGIPVWVGAPTSSTWHGLAPAGGKDMVRAPAVSRIDLYADCVLASNVPLDAPALGEISDAGRP